jgi:polysaccharide biosynthesis protein PelF
VLVDQRAAPAHTVTDPTFALASGRRGPRVLLVTEGTYPYAVGGVSSWCDLLLRSLHEIDWQVLPIIAAHGRPPIFTLPANARQIRAIALWSERLPPRRDRRLNATTDPTGVPAALMRGLLAWDGDVADLTDALVACRADPRGIRHAFRSGRGWTRFLDGLRDVLDERQEGAGVPPQLDVVEAAGLYQTLYWIARTAGVPTPETDVLLATAAGWSAIPAVVHKRLHGTPLIVTEHGVFVREAYLAAIRGHDSVGGRFVATRLARGLARLAYATTDVVAPVTEANAVWARGLGVDPEKILVLRNGMRSVAPATPLPNAKTIVSIGRIDPLKDIQTMLRVAKETVRVLPDARFLHFGPVTEGEERYAHACLALHRSLGLGEGFRFMGRTTDPTGVMRSADIVLMTSISEGLPMSILEAMSQGRPVVTTGVGGVPDVVRGCGIVTAPGDVPALALGITTLLRNPQLAQRLGERGHRRLHRVFDESYCIDGYRELLTGVASGGAVR